MTVHIIHLTENVSVTSLPFCKNESVSVAWERKSISSILTELKTHRILIALLEAISISGVISRLAYHFRNIVETNNIIDTVIGGLVRLFILTETIDLADFITTSKGHITRILFEEIPTIMERISARTEGPSWRWRFNPWKKSSMDNEFEPEREHPIITMPTLPTSEQLKMVAVTIKQKFSLLFPFITFDEDNS